jgi:tyrosyl-tRNA synthetase
MTKKEQIAEILERGVAEIVERKSLEKLLGSGKKLRVKLGIDPTSPNIHVGRAVVLWKLRAFQELGHQVVFICGDFTGLIGDTSDKEAERPMLSEAQIQQNIKSYFAQAGKIIDAKKAEMHYNSKWLKKLGFLEIGKMADAFSLHEFASRELIKKRLDAGKRVSLRELLYPLMQGYDSVAVKADIELGGTDQRFNLLAGRTIQPLYGMQPQNIITTELLEGTDGRKMSSSWGNVINLVDLPQDMFGKVMSIKDELIAKYFTLATRVPSKAMREILRTTQNPRDQKLRLAFEITALYHGKVEAAKAQQGFLAQFSRKELPKEIPEKRLKPGQYGLVDLLGESGLAASKTEARRLLQQGGVKVDQAVVKADLAVVLKAKQEILLQVGKRKYLRLVGGG